MLFNKIYLYIKFLAKPHICKNLLKNNLHCGDSGLIKFYVRNYIPKILILRWDKFFHFCFVKKNKTWGKFLKNTEYLFENRKDILKFFYKSKKYKKFIKIKKDLLQRSLDEMGIVTTKVNLIWINEIIFLLNYFI